jgi:hypothetical protein
MGGWDTTKTQTTRLTPRVVAATLPVVDKFVKEFNYWLEERGLDRVSVGRPTGSSAYYAEDLKENPEKIYGDIDLQMIGSPIEGKTYGQFAGTWNKLADEFVKEMQPHYIDVSESKAGHPIFSVDDDFVQVDFMWHEPKLALWGAHRVTPERGVKGSLHGNMFSVFGELLNLSIQHAGVQLKTIDGVHVPFSKQKGTEVATITTSPGSFIYDVFAYEALLQGIEDFQLSDMLAECPGNSLDSVKISRLVRGVKGFAESCTLNNMFGRDGLADFASEEEFLQKFLTRYEEKAMIDVNASKRNKAFTPDAIARAQADKLKVLTGLETVKGYFNET